MKQDLYLSYRRLGADFLWHLANRCPIKRAAPTRDLLRVLLSFIMAALANIQKNLNIASMQTKICSNGNLWRMCSALSRHANSERARCRAPEARERCEASGNLAACIIMCASRQGATTCISSRKPNTPHFQRPTREHVGHVHPHCNPFNRLRKHIQRLNVPHNACVLGR